MLFKDKPLNERILGTKNILKKYPDRVPVLIYKNANAKCPNIDKEKYLVPKDLSVGQLLYVIRKRIKLNESEGLYIFFNDTLVNTNMTILEVYNQYHNKEDKMLYATYSTENTFG
jgi:GABA(A) receptor-associated protein